MPSHSTRLIMQNWPKQRNFTDSAAEGFGSLVWAFYYLEQNVQRREIMKYLTNSVWSSWLSQRACRAGKATELTASHFPLVPVKPKQRSAEIKKKTWAISISGKGERDNKKGGEATKLPLPLPSALYLIGGKNVTFIASWQLLIPLRNSLNSQMFSTLFAAMLNANLIFFF